MIERNAFLKCPICGAEYNLTGTDIGASVYMPCPLHEIGEVTDSSEPHNSMMPAETLNDSHTCKCSEQLIVVTRPDETNKEWFLRATGCQL